MFCAKCGAKLEDSALKCDRCGAPVRIRPASAVFSEEREEMSENVAAPVREEKGKSSGKDSLQDPVFFKEAGSDIDVNSIIRIARGEELREKNEPSKEEEGTRLRKKVEIRKSPAGQRPDERNSITKESWLSSLSPFEKARRRLNESIHLFEERRDEREMQKHIQRAEKYYSNIETSASVTTEKSETLRKTDALQTSVRKKEPGGQERSDRVSGHQPVSEKALAEKEQGNRVPVQRKAPEKDVVIREQERLEEARREKEAVQKAVRQARERQTQEHVRLANAAFSSSALPQEDVDKKTPVQTSYRKDEEDSVSAEAAKTAAATESASSVEAAALAAAAATPVETEAADSAGPAPRDLLENDPYKDVREKAEEIKTSYGNKGQEKAETLHGHADIQKEDRKGRELAEKDISRQQSQEIFENRRVWTDEDRGLENARLLRRMREDESDDVDEFLSSYGMSKELAVRLATLFLIAVLSVIYVMGRSKVPEVSSPAEEMTGAPSAEESDQEGSSDDRAPETEEEEEIPTGGGDFQNTQTP